METLKIAKDCRSNIIKGLETWWGLTLILLAFVVFIICVCFDSEHSSPVAARVLIICICYFLIYLSTFAGNRFIQRYFFKFNSWTSKNSIWVKCILLFITYMVHI